MKKKSLQTTCKDMKAEVTKEQSMHNYNIKAKHMGTMKPFFASKNFDLHTRLPTPPLVAESKDAKGAPPAAKAKAAEKVASDMQKRKDSQASNLSEVDTRMLVVKENIEKDDAELVRQVESSWAQRRGFPAKSGIVM